MSCSCNLASCTQCQIPNSSQTSQFSERLNQLSSRIRNRFQPLSGIAAYNVWLVWTRWEGKERGIGKEQEVARILMQPDPIVSDISSIARQLFPAGTLEVGTLQLSKISLIYTSESLLGREIVSSSLSFINNSFCFSPQLFSTFLQPGQLPHLEGLSAIDIFLQEASSSRKNYRIQEPISFFYEIQEKNNPKAERYKFRPSSLPYRNTSNREWRLNLEKVYEDNSPNAKSQIGVDNYD